MTCALGKYFFCSPMINRQIYVDFRNVNISYQTVAVNIKSIFVICTDFLVSLFVKRVGNDYVVCQAVVIFLRLLKLLKRFLRRNS